ncbi:14156_t:CDS:2, partial [Dentiscutata erythropus]
NKGLATVENPLTHPLFSYTSLSSKKLCSKLQPPLSTLQMPLVLPSLLLLQALPLSPDVQPLQQSPQVQLIQLQQSPPQLLQAQLMQLLPPQVLQSQQSLQAQLMQPQQSLLLSQSYVIQSNPYIYSTLPTIAEFLKEVDEREETGDHYKSFLEKFNAQRIL